MFAPFFSKQFREYYEILNVPAGAGEREIRAAYLAAALRYHPDRNPEDENAGEKFKLLREAYVALKAHARQPAGELTRVATESVSRRTFVPFTSIVATREARARLSMLKHDIVSSLNNPHAADLLQTAAGQVRRLKQCAADYLSDIRRHFLARQVDIVLISETVLKDRMIAEARVSLREARQTRRKKNR